uniref:NADH dehydrogenase subunit 6 n=1 Tax=Phryganopsyche latipennis TaxID=177652 RepID=A0A4Y1JWK0_9NEOP|nr:NADH dehydrogenase subunit 6 [Phryganopsyche latipennis]APQ47900.1 NADH dehydrogenase subunit 6 [Phryganopsyche latipennis]
MTTLIFHLIIFMNFSILFFSHPFIITLMMIIQTLFMSLIIGMMNFSFWLTYLMFLIFIGGLLILFIYISSLTPNKILHFNKIKVFIFFIFLSKIFLIFNLHFNFLNLEMLNFNNFNYFFNAENSLYLTNLFNNNELWLTLILMKFLLFTLITSIKISNFFGGPMRIKFYWKM